MWVTEEGEHVELKGMDALRLQVAGLIYKCDDPDCEPDTFHVQDPYTLEDVRERV